MPNRIINIETLLNTVPQPEQEPEQEPEHTRHMDNIIRLTKEVDKNLPNPGELELAAFKIAVENIKKKTSRISSEHLQFHLRTLRRSQHLSDEINRNNPTEATAWYLQTERTLGLLIRLGDR